MPFGASALATPYDMHAPSALQRDATPTAESSSSPAARQDTTTVFNADDGWSVAIDVDFWVMDEDDAVGNHVSLWKPDAGTMSIDSVDAEFTLPRGLSGESLSFNDTRECLPWINSSFPELTIATADDGAPLIEESTERSRAVYISGVDGQTVFYTECRMLVPGESYVWFLASAPNTARFNIMFPEIIAISESLTIPGMGATPAPSN